MASLFTKICNWEIPGDIVFQNDDFFVLKDINPEDTTHLLIIPKEEIVSLLDIPQWKEQVLSEMMILSVKLAKKFDFIDWYKVVMNAWDYQEVPHIHLHVISKRG